MLLFHQFLKARASDPFHQLVPLTAVLFWESRGMRGKFVFYVEQTDRVGIGIEIMGIWSKMGELIARDATSE